MELNIFEFMGISDSQTEAENPLDDFFTRIANGALLKLMSKRQTGIHYGQTLYAHLLNVVLTVDLAAQLIGCTILERRILICASILHDLNKLDPQGRSISQVAKTEEIINFLKEYDLDQLLPNLIEHVEIIRRLIAAHSGHLHQGADSLLPLAGPITRTRLQNVLVPLLQLADQADVARNFFDDAKRQQVISSLNAASDIQYRWEWHRLNEFRGPFSNLIHNAVCEEMEQQLDAKPFLHYGEGTFYLVPSKSPASLLPDTFTNVANRLSKKIKTLKSGKAEDFVTGSPTGTKINSEVFATSLTIREVFRVAASNIRKKVFKGEKIAESEANARRRAKEGYETLLDSNKYLFSRDPEVMQTGELLRVIYNFLQGHCEQAFKGKNKKYDDAWQPIYKKCALNVKEEWGKLDALNDRAYVIGRTLFEEREGDFSSILETVTELAEEFETSYQLRGNSDQPPTELNEYLKSTLVFSCLVTSRTAFSQYLQSYSNEEIDVCSLCGMPFPGQTMMAGDVPKGLTVAQFSNRNFAGKGDPKRNSCAICREQLLIEKIGFAPAQSKGFYLHIYPESFVPPLYVEALRQTFRQLVGQEIRTLLFDTRAIAKDYETTKQLKLSFKTKATGLALPLYSDLVGNIITLPIYALGDNETERYLFAMNYAFFIHQRFGQRVVLTQSIIPPVTMVEMQESSNTEGIKIYLDDLPYALRGLIRQNNLNGKQADEAFELLQALKRSADEIGTGEDLCDLARSLNDGELGIFFAAHRILERSNKKDGVINNIAANIFPYLKFAAEKVYQLLKGENRMSDLSLTKILEDMSDLAWKRSIRGNSLAHTALIKPMDIIFQLLRRQQMHEVSYLKLIAKEDVLRHIERTSDYNVGGEREEAISQWVTLFFDELLQKGFHGDIRRLLLEEKYVKAAYTTLMRYRLREASEAKKQTAKT